MDRRFVRFHNFTHPKNLNEEDVVKYMNHLANDLNVAASTQNQALSAIVFLYSHILSQPLHHLDKLKRAKKPKRLPVVLTGQDTMSIIHSMDGVPKLVVSLLYGSELRISEALRLRIQDLDLNYKQMTVRYGKGLRDRITMIPESRIDQIRHHIQKHVTPHTFRHSFATHFLSSGYDSRTVQELLGYKSVKTTRVYIHVFNKGGQGVKSPLDRSS